MEDAVVVVSESRLAGVKGMYREGTDHVCEETPAVGDETVEGLSDGERIPEGVNSGVLTESKDSDNEDQASCLLVDMMTSADNIYYIGFFFRMLSWHCSNATSKQSRRRHPVSFTRN
jgi:hypothetical protein